MPKDDWVYLAPMREMAKKAILLSVDTTREKYDNDEKLRLALTHIIQVISEAAQQVSNDFQHQNSQLPWREIIGMRHRIVHDYLDVDEDVIWGGIQSDLLPLIAGIEAILPIEYW